MKNASAHLHAFVAANSLEEAKKYFIDFLREKTDLFAPNEKTLQLNPERYQHRFANVIHLAGYLKLSDYDRIPLYFIPTSELNERASRKLQFSLGKDLLKNEIEDTAGIFVFFDNHQRKRVSYIEKIFHGGATQYSSFRRHTFFISPDQTNKTFLLQFNEGDFHSQAGIKEVFSVEKVTIEFYREISNWYYWALTLVRFPDDAEQQPNGREIALIRFITRIIFIWFMKEKGLVPDKLFLPHQLNSILINLDDNESTYYKAILQNLFFATLNTPISDRKFRRENNAFGTNPDYMNHTYFRFHKFFKRPDDMVDLFNNIPFLNGGLFECLDKSKNDPENDTGKEIRIDGFSDVESKQVIFPNFLFFSDEITVDLSSVYQDKKHSKAQTRGIINILSAYNFTIDENTLNDEEIALDPELLGNIFENLLAAYNPETSTSARKATGSYYTPRVIVDYMVSESLKAHFITQYTKHFPQFPIDEFKKHLETLFSDENEHNPFDENTTNFLIQKIHQIKIIDPAVGSGAFPMGILHKLVFLLSKLDPHNLQWKQEQINALHHLTDPKLKQKLIQKIEENFLHNELDYGRKLYLIQNCIYGVDIQPIATQIAKLRFFISLLVDEKANNKEENYGIEPLPNLETKLVAANTLIALPKEPYHCPKMDDIIRLEKELFEVRNRYFTANTQKEKNQIQKLDSEIRNQLKQLIEDYARENQNTLHELQNELEALPVVMQNVTKTDLLETKQVRKDLNEEKRNSLKIRIKELEAKVKADEILLEKYRKIAEFNIFHSNASADWFDPEWMFGVKDGFDIVIGNPPYISTKGVNEIFKKHLEQQFGFADDTYNHFYFKGIELLKNDAVLAYISSKTFWTIQTKKNLRQMILKNKLLQIFDTANPFASAMVDTCVTLIQKTDTTTIDNYSFMYLDGKNSLSKPTLALANIEVYNSAPNQVFFPITDYNLKIYHKYGKKVNELLNTWWDKISTSKNIEKFNQELEKYRQNLKPGDITLLGLITEGGQGLATANNGKYVGVLDGTKWADNVRKQRPEKLLSATEFCKKENIKNPSDAAHFLKNMTEYEIRKLFDVLKEKYGRDIFGQGWLYRIVSKNEIADVESLTEDEKLNGISGEKTFVPYDKGDKDGNRWYAPTPYYIDWSRENVKFLQNDPKARWQGYQFYFREGFCWSDIHTILIRCRYKTNGIHDVKSMSLFTLDEVKIPTYYLICLINSTFLSEYDFNFVNNTQTFQINDARQLPIIIPNNEQLKFFEDIFNRAVAVQKEKFAGKISETEAEERLKPIQEALDRYVEEMYMGGSR